MLPLELLRVGAELSIIMPSADHPHDAFRNTPKRQ
jgi:hypothetical protein